MEANHAGWFEPGSISLSFTFFLVGALIATGVVASLVRYLSHRNAGHAHAGHHH